ncbi:hypothetical protein ACFO3O_08125 [Dokdonia ponticola]|uniref:Lipocalin-like domain-containing protein n=1 Tax=Dokdonia ponticola TaxID=2041041 RepID=A0ABV9HVU9_9FLAO
MKTLLKMAGMLVLLLTLGCGNNDDTTPPEMEITASIIGDWQRTSGSLIGVQWEYLLIKPDNTMNLFFQDDNGFRDENTGNYTATDNQVTVEIGFFGSVLLNYTLTDSTLELLDSSGNVSTYNRVTNAPSSDTWIQKLTIISQGDAPWDETADIAFNGTQILLGNGYAADNIGLINPETFALDGVIITTQSAFAVEVEKFDVPDKYIFQSNNGSTQFKAYTENTNTEAFTSLELGPWIYGLASKEGLTVWASSGNEETLYLLDYNNESAQIITRTIPLDRRVDGMDYQNDLLYVCSQGNIYICDVSSSFEVLETLTVEGYRAYGIAFDGTNFWINASSNNGDPNQLIKTSLTL